MLKKTIYPGGGVSRALSGELYEKIVIYFAVCDVVAPPAKYPAFAELQIKTAQTLIERDQGKLGTGQ